MQSTEPGRRERRKQETRARLLDVALALFASDGYEATTMDRIAEGADVARQTVLNYFPRKEDLVKAWVERRRDRLVVLLRDTEFRDRSAGEQLLGLVGVMARYDEQETRVARAISEGWLRYDSGFFAAASPPPAFADTIREGVRRGEFAEALDVDLVAETLYDLYLQALNRWLHSDTEFPLGPALHHKFEMLLTGLRIRN